MGRSSKKTTPQVQGENNSLEERKTESGFLKSDFLANEPGLDYSRINDVGLERVIIQKKKNDIQQSAFSSPKSDTTNLHDEGKRFKGMIYVRRKLRQGGELVQQQLDLPSQIQTETIVQLVGTPIPVESSVQGGEGESKSDEDGSEEASDDEPSKVQAAEKSHTASTKSSSSGDEEESSSGEKGETSKEDGEKDKAPKKNVDVEMVDVLPKKPDAEKSSLSSEKKETRPAVTQSETLGSKTLFVGNLSFSVEKTDVENLFKDYGDLVDIRFGMSHDGAFKGFGHIEFATVEAARKAFEEKNGHELLGRPLKVDIAAEKGAYTPHRRDASAYQKAPGIDRPTVYVRGFDKSGDEQAIKDGLRKHFSSCGEITRISLPRDSNGLKGFAYIDFTNISDVTNALGLNKSQLNEHLITVEAARPRDQNVGSGSRFNDQRRSGSRFGDHRGGRFGHRGGRR